MNEFYRALEYINKNIYKPSGLNIESIREEKQNINYVAGTFNLSSQETSKTVRFRVAKETPTKIGQFVAFWEKDENNKNQAFDYKNAPDLLVINTFSSNKQFGQFVFPKEILLKQNILRSEASKGKMGIRVYPSWDNPTSKQAIKTHRWQLEYFIDMTDSSGLAIKKYILKAYLFK